MREVVINKGEKEVVNMKDLLRFLDELPVAKWKLTAERKDKRTTQQNKYLHAVMLPIIRDALREAGWNQIKTIEDAKDYVKVKFLKYDLANEQTGEVENMFKKTSALSKLEFMELVQDVQIWLQDYFSIDLPMPGTQVKMFE